MKIACSVGTRAFSKVYFYMLNTAKMLMDAGLMEERGKFLSLVRSTDSFHAEYRTYCSLFSNMSNYMVNRRFHDTRRPLTLTIKKCPDVLLHLDAAPGLDHNHSVPVGM